MEWLKIAIDYGIMGLLALLSAVAVAIAVERHLVYRKLQAADYPDKRFARAGPDEQAPHHRNHREQCALYRPARDGAGIMLTFQTMGRDGFMDTARSCPGLPWR